MQIGTHASRPVGTHDGARSYGGYLWQAVAHHLAPRSDNQLVADCIKRAFLSSSEPDIVVVGDESDFEHGGIGWRYLQLGLEQIGIHGKVNAPHQVQFELNGRMLTLVSDLPPNTVTALNRGRGLDKYDLRVAEPSSQAVCSTTSATQDRLLIGP